MTAPDSVPTSHGSEHPAGFQGKHPLAGRTGPWMKGPFGAWGGIAVAAVGPVVKPWCRQSLGRGFPQLPRSRDRPKEAPARDLLSEGANSCEGAGCASRSRPARILPTASPRTLPRPRRLPDGSRRDPRSPPGSRTSLSESTAERSPGRSRPEPQGWSIPSGVRRMMPRVSRPAEGRYGPCPTGRLRRA